MKDLIIGFGEADHTPEGRVVELAGQYYQRIANGIHSRLKTVAMLIEQDNECSLMISLDVVSVPNEFCKVLQEKISQKYPEIPAERIIINATHTHSGPALIQFRDWWEDNSEAISSEEYRFLVTESILKAVGQAIESKQTVGISSAVSFARVGHCRRAVYSNQTAEMYGKTNRDDFTGMEGGEDSGVDIMFVFDKNSKAVGAVVNVPCPSQVMEATYKISSDYMGRLRLLMKERFGNDFFTLCQIAPAGCQSPRDLTRSASNYDLWHEAGVEIIAQRLADSIDNVWEKLHSNIKYNVDLVHLTKQIKLPRRKVTYDEFVDAQNKLSELCEIQSTEKAFADFCSEIHTNENIANRPGPYDSKLHHYVKIRNEEAVIKRYNEQDENPLLDMELHAVRIGDNVFVTNPFELYLDFGHCIRARSQAAQTFMIQLCNGSNGYLPSKRAQELGGYGGLVINGEIGADGGSKLVDETVMQINRVL